MRVTGRSTRVALRDDVVGDALGHALVKAKFFPMNLFLRPSSCACRVYSMMPPSTVPFLKPLCLR